MYNKYLQDAISMAKAVGDLQLSYFRSSHLDMQTKLNDSDVVTNADKESEKLIRDYIKENFPDHGIIAEESGSDHEENEWRWVVDPLDGTTNYSQGLPVFSVSIALEHNSEAVVGVVYAPYLGELFHAVKGGGAFMNGRSVRCSSKNELSKAVLATGMPYDKMTNPDNNLSEIVKIAPVVRGVRRYGSAAIDLCYVAAGFFDGYWELNLNRWDVAAGMLIASEAGARISSLRENRKFSLLASSPALHDQLFTILGK